MLPHALSIKAITSKAARLATELLSRAGCLGVIVIS
jgi:hypothetical protein